MKMGKIVRCLSVGILFGILAIGLLPFLVIYNCAEMSGLIDLETSPVILSIAKFIGETPKETKSDSADSE